MLWQLILEEFGPNIQNIDGFENILSDTLSRFTSTPRDKYYTCKRMAQCCANELLAISRAENNKDYFLINILIVQREQYIELININTKFNK